MNAGMHRKNTQQHHRRLDKHKYFYAKLLRFLRYVDYCIFCIISTTPCRRNIGYASSIFIIV